MEVIIPIAIMLAVVVIIGVISLFLKFMSHEDNLQHQVTMHELATGTGWAFLEDTEKIEKTISQFKLMYSAGEEPIKVYSKQIYKQAVNLFEFSVYHLDRVANFYCILVQREIAAATPVIISDLQVKQWFETNSRDVVLLNPKPEWWNENLFAHLPPRSIKRPNKNDSEADETYTSYMMKSLTVEAHSIDLEQVEPLIGSLVQHPFFAGVMFNQNYVALHTFGYIPIIDDLFVNVINQAESLASELAKIDQPADPQSEVQKLKDSESNK